jgi:hypothetical protein
MGLRETELEGVDWIHLVLDRDHWLTLVNTVMNVQVLYKGKQFLDNFFPTRTLLHGVSYGTVI